MIAILSGIVAGIGPDGVVVEVGGVGILVSTTPAALGTLRVGERASLSTSLVVREDSLTLFGFLSEDERAVFELLQTASGVGPRLALAMLAVHGPDDLRRIMTTDDINALALVPGIGKKGAARIVLELKDKLGPVTGSAPGFVRLPGATDGWREQLRSGLAGLGWSAREIDEALVALGPEADASIAVGDEPDVRVLLKRALQLLSRA